jgi:arginine utilization protein RocB
VFVDQVAGETPPPPVCLQQIDLKSGYDVTTPRAAWCLYNVLTHGLSPVRVIEHLRREVQQALDAAVGQMQRAAAHYSAIAGRLVTTPKWQPQTLTFAELKQQAVQHSGSAVEQLLLELNAQLRVDKKLTLPQLSLSITNLLWSLSGLTGPAAVIGLAGLYYPPILLQDTSSRHLRVKETVARQAALITQTKGCSIRLRPFFPGISDMSFMGNAGSAEDIAAITNNTPSWGSRIQFDFSVGQKLDLPTINIGPWGRDYHQRTERVNMPYSFDVVPELIWRVVDDLVG